MTTMGKTLITLGVFVCVTAISVPIYIFAKRAIVKHEIQKAIERQLASKELLDNGLSAEPDNRFELEPSKSDNSKRYQNNPAPSSPRLSISKGRRNNPALSSPRLSSSEGQRKKPAPLLPRNDFSVFAKYIISSYNVKVAGLSGRFRAARSNSQKADAAIEYLRVLYSILTDQRVQNYVKTLKLIADNGDDIETELMVWLQSLATPENKDKLAALLTDLYVDLKRIAPEIPKSLRNGHRKINALSDFTEEDLVLLYKCKPLIDKFINGIGSII